MRSMLCVRVYINVYIRRAKVGHSFIGARTRVRAHRAIEYGGDAAGTVRHKRAACSYPIVHQIACHVHI